MNIHPKVLKHEGDLRAVQSALASFYRHRPVQYYKSIDSQDYEHYAALIASYAPRAARVLDLGPGGYLSPLALHQRGFDVDACDVWDESFMAAQALRLPQPGPRMAAYDGLRLPYEDMTFDVVASMAVMEHLVDPSHFLREADRVLRPGGLQVHLAPNWAGPHVVAHAAVSVLIRRQRYWQYSSWLDVLVGCFRSLWWPVAGRYGPRQFILVWPRIVGGSIAFERSDDDCVHLCCPTSLWRWFDQHGYRLLRRNQGAGESMFARRLNSVVPALATTNVVVARKLIA